VVFHLTFSAPFQILRTLDEDPRPMDQRAFVRLLRHDLGMAQPTVNAFRRLDWKTAVEATGEVVHGRDRMGREINAQVIQAAELPEDLMVSVPVYREAGERQPVSLRCDVEIDAARQTLQLSPIPGEIENAIDDAQRSIRERLGDVGPAVKAVYYGRP
jgi:hypothetical protein